MDLLQIEQVTSNGEARGAKERRETGMRPSSGEEKAGSRGTMSGLDVRADQAPEGLLRWTSGGCMELETSELGGADR